MNMRIFASFRRFRFSSVTKDKSSSRFCALRTFQVNSNRYSQPWIHKKKLHILIWRYFYLWAKFYPAWEWMLSKRKGVVVWMIYSRFCFSIVLDRVLRKIWNFNSHLAAWKLDKNIVVHETGGRRRVKDARNLKSQPVITVVKLSQRDQGLYCAGLGITSGSQITKKVLFFWLSGVVDISCHA